MKTLIHSLVISLLSITALADIVPPIKWDIETGRLEPRPYSLSIRRGESVKIEPRFMSYSTPISLTNTTVEMRYASDYDMATYYSVAGILHTDTGRVEIAWNDSLNPTNASMVYEIRATAGTNVLARAYGPLTFLGGMVGINTGLVARTSLDWATISQANGTAVLSNQMGSGATWSGSNWTFGAGADDLAWTNKLDASATNTLAPRSWVAGFSNAPATWNSDFQTVDVALPDGVTGQMFQENHVYGKNDTGTVISNGAVCYIANASGFNCGFEPANATNGFLTSLRTIGIATHDIGIGASGKVTTFGNVNDINTTHLIEGQPVYLDSVSGRTTTNSTTYPNANVHLGVCLRSHANVGRIYVTVQSIPHAQDIGAATAVHSQPLSTITNAGSLAYSNGLTAVDVGAVAPIHNGSLVLTNGDGGVPQLTLQTLNDTESSALQFVYGAKTQLVTYADAIGFQRHTMAYSITPATMYDSENFLAGTHYLAPNGSGTNLTALDLNPSLTNPVAKALSALSTNDQYVLTGAGISAAGGVTNQWNDPCLASSNLISMFSGTTCTWTRAWGNALNITPTGTVYFAADSTLTDTNVVTGVTLDLFYNGQTFGFVGASVTNTATLVSNAWNSIIFWKGYGSSVLVGK